MSSYWFYTSADNEHEQPNKHQNTQIPPRNVTFAKDREPNFDPELQLDLESQLTLIGENVVRWYLGTLEEPAKQLNFSEHCYLLKHLVQSSWSHMPHREEFTKHTFKTLETYVLLACCHKMTKHFTV